MIMPLALYALALAAFAIGTTEFVISGILPAVSTDLGVSIPTAGLLVTGYAAGVALGGPVLALLTARFPAKPMIIALMLIFAFGQILCAMSPSYALLLAARLVSAAGHGVFFGVASVAITKLVPEHRRGAALSLFVGGITVANILGLPGGTALGNALGWRATFFAIAAFAVLAAVLIAITLPATRTDAAPDAPLRMQVAQLQHQQVWATFLMIGCIMIGALAFGTFQVPILTDVTGVLPQHVPWFLLLSGAGAVLGIWAGGKLADWRLMPSLLAILACQIVSYALLLLAAPHIYAMGVMMFVSGFFGFAFSAPVQVRILNAARVAPNLASTLVSTAYNIGIAGGAFLGATLLTMGLTYAMLPAVGVVSSTIALAIGFISWRAETSPRATILPA